MESVSRRMTGRRLDGRRWETGVAQDRDAVCSVLAPPPGDGPAEIRGDLVRRGVAADRLQALGDLLGAAAGPMNKEPAAKAGVLQASSPEARTGAAMSRMAMVARPAPIPGLRSWTIETREPAGQ